MSQEESGGSECCQKEAQMATGLRTVGVRGVVKGREKLTDWDTDSDLRCASIWLGLLT